MTSVIKALPMERKLQDGILTIETAAEQLLAIVNNVLDIERLEAGAMQLDIVNFDMHNLVAHVRRIIAALPAAGALDIESSVDPEVPRFLLGDQGRISQIVINLMSNAVKFTERGSVRLRVSSQAEGPDRVRVRFAVQDTGKGIPRSMHQRVFESFEQVSASTGGTGLGLTISREFAKRMGGELTLESSEGAGSTFTFSVPLQCGLPQPANEPQRLSALHALGILDSAPEPVLDELVAEAARVCEVPIALVSLVDEHRQWFKAQTGLEVSETPREQAFCAHAILTPERLMVVPDAQADPRFSANPLVTADPRIRFYAAAPLVDAAGHALGTLCVLDRVPRELTVEQLAELHRLAGTVMALLSMRSLRVLVAEDTPASQLVLRLMLEQQGHSVRVVGDGEQAVRAFAEEPFDLVLLDIQMPVMDGLKAARALRRLERGGRDFPIVGLSAYATQKDRDNAIESGMTSYLTKPVRASDLATLIAQLMKARPATGMAPAARQGIASGGMVDEAALRQLSDDLGPEAMATALAQFEFDARAFLERLRLSAAADDGEQMRKTAHRLKGLFLQFGASAAARHSAELEQAPGGPQAKAVQRLIELGRDSIAAVRAATNEMLSADARSLPHS
jgi:CheY-like chemotaxis protein/HPt (histidine-containing phosphotransfer) domain-containing protein